MLPQRRPGDTHVGPVNDRSVDVTADATIGDREAELLARTIPRAEIEAGSAQPADAEVLELMPGVEDAQDAAVEIFAVVLRRACVFVDQLPRTRLADAAGAEVIARRPGLIGGDKRGIDGSVDLGCGVGDRRRSPVDGTRARVEVDEVRRQGVPRQYPQAAVSGGRLRPRSA